MKRPKLSDLKIDYAGTKNLRAQLRETKKIKITINFDTSSLGATGKSGGKTSPPYSRFLSQLFKDNLDKRAISRLDRLEKELKKLKRQIAA